MEMDLPPALESLVLRCLSKEARNRPQSADELRDALEAIKRDLETTVISECGEPGWGRGRRRLWWLKHAPDQLGNMPAYGKYNKDCKEQLAICRKKMGMLLDKKPRRALRVLQSRLH